MERVQDEVKSDMSFKLMQKTDQAKEWNTWTWEDLILKNNID